MAQLSSIEWTDATWNPVTGCSKISSGCMNCYAERMAKRLKAMGVVRYSEGFDVRVHDDLIEVPLKWKNPRVIFVNSMSDLFHEEVPDYFIKNIFEIMNSCPQHTFQVLTKRSQRLKELSDQLRWTHNIWMGVSVEDADVTYRINDLVKTSARVKFVSCEPLLGPISKMPLKNIDWLIVGGESGPHARPMVKRWAISIRNQCIKHNVPYFFKQWGGTRKKENGRILEGRTWDEMPPLSHKSLFDAQL